MTMTDTRIDVTREGTAGILRDQAPPPLNGRVGNDALIVSSDNEMTA